MALTLQILASGSIVSGSVSYPTAAVSGKMALVQSLFITNTSTGTNTINVTAKKGGGTFAHISPKDLQLSAGAHFIIDTPVALMLDGTFDQITVATSAAAEYLLTGVLRDI